MRHFRGFIRKNLRKILVKSLIEGAFAERSFVDQCDYRPNSIGIKSAFQLFSEFSQSRLADSFGGGKSHLSIIIKTTTL
jgi:hypothetical protein